MCSSPDRVGITHPVFVDRFCDSNRDCEDGSDEDSSVIQCAAFGEPTANGCCNTYVLDGDEYVASGQTSTGHDIFVNTNTNGQINHLGYYTGFVGGDKWYRVGSGGLMV